MIKSLILRFFSAFSDPMSYREEEREALIEAQKNIKLKGSEEERLKATKEWSKPENVALRLANYKEGVKPVLPPKDESYSEYNLYLLAHSEKPWRIR